MKLAGFVKTDQIADGQPFVQCSCRLLWEICCQGVALPPKLPLKVPTSTIASSDRLSMLMLSVLCAYVLPFLCVGVTELNYSRANKWALGCGYT